MIPHMGVVWPNHLAQLHHRYTPK